MNPALSYRKIQGPRYLGVSEGIRNRIDNSFAVAVRSTGLDYIAPTWKLRWIIAIQSNETSYRLKKKKRNY